MSHALLEGPPLGSTDQHGSGLASIVAERALAYGDQRFAEIDRRGRERSEEISALHARAWRLVPVLDTVADADAAVVVFVESVFDYVSAAWACLFSGRTFVACAYSAVTTSDAQFRARLGFLSDRLDRPLLLTTQTLNEWLAPTDHAAFAEVVSLDEIVPLTQAIEEGDDLADSVARLASVDGPDRCRFLTLTSGSTGTPKLVDIGAREMRYRLDVVKGSFGDERYLNLRPFDGAFQPLYQLVPRPNGLVYIRPERAFADPLRVLRAAEEHRIEHISSTNSFFAKLVEALDERPYGGCVSSLRSLQFSGEMTSPDVAAAIVERLRSLGANEVEARFLYGSSEAGFISVISDRELAKETSVAAVPGVLSQGPLLAGQRLRVVDEEGAVLGHGEVGRIELCRGAQTFTGYHGDPAATSAAFTPDGWYRSGDLGFVDHVGVTVTGRVAGMIIVNGRDVSLAQVEGQLAGVEGVEHPLVACAPVTPEGGVAEELAVFFVPAEGPGPELGEVSAEIRRCVVESSGIAAHHLVAVPAADFPWTSSGKVDRPRLVEGFESGRWSVLSAAMPSGEGPADTDLAVPEWLADRWSHVLGLTRGAGGAGSFFDLGGDSLKFAELMIAIEDEAGVQVPAQRFFARPELANLAMLLDESLGGASAAGGRPGGSSSPREVMRQLEAMLSSWNGERQSQASLAVGANTRGARTPIVWICQSNAEFRLLADALGADQPLYGLRSLDQLVHVDDLTSAMLDAVAHRYLAEILALGLGPRLVIGGNCSGAIVALSVARKARHAGNEPRPLVLLNWMFSFGRYEGPVTLLQGMEGGTEFALTDWEGRSIDWRPDFPLAATRVLPGGHAQYFSGAPMAAFAAALREHTEPLSRLGRLRRDVLRARSAVGHVRDVIRPGSRHPG